ncbi:MAG: outer membrane beta-barrel family protein [Muribaculaceae bacterium]|nr:outer membrane beta-barrel family protein [Muribaculaceae bacterium]
MALGNVYMTSAETLKEVTVQGSSIKDIKGRTIVFPSPADVKASATSLRLFMKLPLAGLEANPINRTLSVDGGTPMILINGVPSTIQDVNALKPGDILKIEFSRMTPARYADRGYSGLLNITLKKRTDGGQVYLWGRSAVATAFVDANLRVSYHQGPSRFTLSYNPSWRNYNQVYDFSKSSYIGDDFRVNLESHDRNPFNYAYHTVRFKYDYSPNTATLFSATFNAEPSSNHRRTIAQTNDSELGVYENYNESRSTDFAPSLDLFFRRDFNDKNSLEAQVVGTLSSSDYRRDNHYIFEGGADESYIMNTDSRRRSLISEISYTHSFSDRTSLSGGVQNTLSHSTNKYLDSDYKPVLTENNNYIYAKFGQQINKVYLSLASGMKLFWIENDLNKRHFTRNLTTVQASWNPDNRWSLTGAFAYSPIIPSLSALTDYPQQVSPYLISNGNPDLKVAGSFIYQLMPAYRYKKFNASLLMTVRTIDNFVFDDVNYIGNHLFLSQSINARRYNTYGANLNMRISDIAGFGANINLGLNHYETEVESWSRSLTSFSGSLTIWWNHGPYTISYWRKIPGKSLYGYSVSKNENGDALSFEYQPDKRWTFGVDWMYMFDKKGTRYPSESYSPVNSSVSDRYIKHNGNMVVLSASYSADFGSLFRSGRRSLNNSDNGSSLLKL